MISDSTSTDVTIGICVKNREKTIAKAIQSLFNQTFPHNRMQAIIVDGGSTDKTIRVLKDLFLESDIPFQLLSDNGMGLAAARNLIIFNAVGNYVVWLDDDMEFSDNFVQQEYDLINSNPLIGVVSAKQKFSPTQSTVARLEILSNDSDYDVIKKKNQKRSSMSMVRVEVVRKVGGFDNKIVGAGEDADLTARIKSAGYLLCNGEAQFEHEERQTWKEIWSQNYWYGYGMHYISHKNKNLVSFRYRFLPIAFATGVARSLSAFVALRKSFCFLLPFFNSLKALAWWWGFFSSHASGYGHN